MNRFQCVADLRAEHGVKRLCQVLGIARSGFYYWQATALARAARQAADERLTAKIAAVHAASDGTYGVPRVTAELRETGGESVNHEKVARLMKTASIAGFRLLRPCPTW
ncbi:IS3 family transposase [Streptomyces sp. TRM75561]|uniref:IS3 family transposase n=1 Tax=Streptomyces sp. TRM75561 TaxID=2975269 RepID=UPI002447C131|nr:IS3 family transposase [Streptomyces sp. TRM75561]MDH3039355.1 IS3 family transposase [Streptomyces sp. TRM75561]